MNLEVLDGMVRDAARDVLAARGLALPAPDAGAAVRRPRRAGHGDYATSIALRHAPAAGIAPREFAGWLADALAARPGIASAEVAGPGFVNLRLAAATRGDVLREVGDRYGTGGDLTGQVVELGAWPQGPVSLAGARGAVLDDARERLLTARGARVGRADGTPPVARTTVRGGRIGTWDDLVATFGADAARYALLRDPARTPLEIAPDVLAQRTDVNPVFAVQYAHAHLAATARHAAGLGVEPGVGHGLLDHPREGDLIRTIGEFPEVVRAAAELREPHRVARFLESLAGAYHRFYDSCRVLPMGDEPVTDLHRARLALCVAARRVLANGLALLGVGAPERM